MTKARVFLLVKDTNARGNAGQHCIYLKGQFRNAVIYTNNHFGDQVYRRDYLRAAAENGFELWGGAHHVTMNDCGKCQSCVQVRIDVRNFPETRNRKALMKRHHDIVVAYNATSLDPGHYALYAAYQASRFPGDRIIAEGDFKARMTEWQRMQVLKDKSGMAGMLFYEDCGSALIIGNNYYDRSKEKRSFGTFALLSLVKMAKERGDVDYIYLGPWVKNSDSLDYKKKFHPLEGFDGRNWVPLDPGGNHATLPPKMDNIIKLSSAP